MLDQLKFVRGSVGKGNFDTSLAHFRIKDGFVTGFNGTLAISAPIPLDIECQPDANQLIRAIGNCNETVTLVITPGGKLSIRAGKFKALINCYHEVMPEITPEGSPVAVDGAALLHGLRIVERFVSTDAARPWACGVLLRDKCAFATNNVVLVQYWIGVDFPVPINIPSAAIREVLRVGKPPVDILVSETSLTFRYDDGSWIRTQTLATEWPDLNKVLDREYQTSPICAELFDALDTMDGFVDKLGRVYFGAGSVSTSPTMDDGATYDLDEFPHEGIYNIQMLRLLKGVATNIDFTSYPAPCIFTGDKLRGAIIGLRGDI